MTAAPYPEKPLLLVDDEETWLTSLALALRAHLGADHVIRCHDSRQVPAILAEQAVSLVLLDLVMPHRSGEQLLEEIIANYPETPVMILTGMNQVETAVQCMKRGASDFFVKTLDLDRLVAGVGRVLEHQKLKEEYRRVKDHFLTAEVSSPGAFAEIITANPKMRALFQYLEAVAPSPEPVLICGESGTGKELVARALHRLGTERMPWKALNVAGLDDTVFSDTLFGHTRGAFTGAEKARAGMVEEARGGVLFLDEIGELSPSSQVKLLRLLQEQEYYPLGSDQPRRAEVRIIAATNCELERHMEEGRFRRDLYYRLSTHQVHLPPLRERREDLPLLLEHFLAEAARSLGKTKPTPPAELVTLLGTYHFPGNVRELRAMVFDAVSRHRSRKLSMKSFKEAVGFDQSGDEIPSLEETDSSADPRVTFHDPLPTLKEAANLLVDEAMKRAGQNRTIAARLLGITPQALGNRLKRRKGQKG